MENTATTAVKKMSDIHWKEIAITAAIVLGIGFMACLGAAFAHDGIKAHMAAKAAKKDEAKK